LLKKCVVMWTQKDKIYFLKRKWGGGKFFRNQKALMKAINENTNTEVYVFELKEVLTASDFFKGTIKTRDRDIQLKSLLGEADKYEEAILNFKRMLEEIGESNRSRNVILEKIRVLGPSKDTFNEIVNNYRLKNYILMNVSNSVEWYETVLRCHNFQSLPSKNVSEETLDNFKKAKELIKKKK
jgi:hypothetical protein